VVVHADDKTSQKQTDAKILGSKGANVVSNAAHKDTRPDLTAPKSTYDSAGGSTTLTSPGLHFWKAKHLSSELFDIYGVSGSRDAISVSKELWVGWVIELQRH
jgi:activating signal cointegrator complex subunit 2